MCTHELLSGGVTVFFYFYSSKSSLKEERILYPGEFVQIEIAAEQLMTVFPISILAGWKEEELIIGDIMIYDGGYHILKTKTGEEILLVVKKEEPQFLQCGKFVFSQERIITIGTDFRNEIYYEYSAFLKDRKILLYSKEEHCIMESLVGREGKDAGGLYVNGKAVDGKVLLKKGDKVELFGLHILILPQMLVCSCVYGTLRTAERKDEIIVSTTKRRENKSPFYSIRQGALQDEKMQKDEIELELPESVRQEVMQPLFLAIGPAFTMMIPTLLMMIMGNVFWGQRGGSFYGMTALMTAASAMLTIFWSLINRTYQKRTKQAEIVKKEREYLAYLKKTETCLANLAEENRSILIKKYPSLDQIIKNGEGTVFWNAGKGKQEERLIRLGVGTLLSPIKIKMPAKIRIGNRDRLLEIAYETVDKYRYLTDVPEGIYLGEDKITGIVGRNIFPVILQILMQIMSYYGGQELKLVYFFHENDRKEKELAECLKWLPQIWQDDKKRRFLAGNEREAGEILPYLTEKLRNQMEGSEEKDVCYLFLIADTNLVKGEPIYSFFTKAQKNGGCHVIFSGRRREELPGIINQLIVRESQKEEIRVYQKGIWERKNIVLEECERSLAEKYMRSMVINWNDEIQKENGLPEKVSFLDLYFCQSVEELHCLGRWTENETAERIRVPIGFGNGKRLSYLDVHEKFHGPHGLIAGTTGSGKSELLQTYLLSLAVSFGPRAVNFFIIDYKGGGMGRILCELPHCAGVISNLAGRQIKRALLSIKSENTRRQTLLSMAGVSHVDEYAALYREGKVEEPMPHLMLVVDEFAELKKEEPAFMQEIISMAQIGRSLGVHLLLATQKPAGTIDDKVWSNTRFRLCLRVADRQDSMDMLHRPEAAYLTGAGRCYLQVGNNEMFELLQTGYSKAPYEQQKKQEKAVLISTTGREHTRSVERKDGQISQLEKVVDYVKRSAKKAGLQKARKLWMPELAEQLCLKEIAGWKREGFQFCIGMYDDPYRQQQGPLLYAPMEEGHLCLCGMPATGKSTFLQTLLWQLCIKYEPAQASFLLIASECAGLTCFSQMPHCMGYMRRAEEAECFFYHLEQLLQRRKELFEGISFSQLQKRRQACTAPILLIIDNYGTFREMTADGYRTIIERISREGLQYGIYLVMTGLGTGNGEIPGRLFEKMKRTLALSMNDKVQYGDVLRQYQIPVEPTANVSGRGLCKTDGKVLEFQVPLFKIGDDYERIEQIKQLAEELWKKRNTQEKKEDPEKFLRIPDEPDYEGMWKFWKQLKEEAEQIPLGYQLQSGFIQTISLKNHFPFLISGEAKAGKKNMMHCLISMLALKKVPIAVFDRENNIDNTLHNKVTVLSDENSFMDWLLRFGKKERVGQEYLAVYHLADLIQMLLRKEYLTTELVRELEERIRQKEILVLAINQPTGETEIFGTFWYELFVRTQCGIHLGGNAAGQRILSFEDIGYAQQGRRENVGVGYLKLGHGLKTQRILIPRWERK